MYTPALPIARVGSPQVPLKSWQAPILVIGLTLSCLACERGAAAEQSETDAAAWQSLCPKRTERCSWSASTASPVRRAVCSFPPWSHSQSREMATMRLLAWRLGVVPARLWYSGAEGHCGAAAGYGAGRRRTHLRMHRSVSALGTRGAAGLLRNGPGAGLHVAGTFVVRLCVDLPTGRPPGGCNCRLCCTCSGQGIEGDAPACVRRRLILIQQ